MIIGNNHKQYGVNLFDYYINKKGWVVILNSISTRSSLDDDVIFVSSLWIGWKKGYAQASFRRKEFTSIFYLINNCEEVNELLHMNIKNRILYFYLSKLKENL